MDVSYFLRGDYVLVSRHFFPVSRDFLAVSRDFGAVSRDFGAVSRDFLSVNASLRAVNASLRAVSASLRAVNASLRAVNERFRSVNHDFGTVSRDVFWLEMRCGGSGFRADANAWLIANGTQPTSAINSAASHRALVCSDPICDAATVCPFAVKRLKRTSAIGHRVFRLWGGDLQVSPDHWRKNISRRQTKSFHSSNN